MREGEVGESSQVHKFTSSRVGVMSYEWRGLAMGMGIIAHCLLSIANCLLPIAQAS
jgi:hypothetical protein